MLRELFWAKHELVCKTLTDFVLSVQALYLGLGLSRVMVLLFWLAPPASLVILGLNWLARMEVDLLLTAINILV